MRILIAEDDSVSRKLIERNLENWGHEVLVTKDGREAWHAISKPDAPNLALLDWMMPQIDGIDICRRVRDRDDLGIRYIILLTALDRSEDICTGLEAGADDYIRKPFDKDELKHRIEAGRRIVNLHLDLEKKIEELQSALDNVRQLESILPMCAWCGMVRDDSEYWIKVEDYITERNLAEFSHGICPKCSEKLRNEIDQESRSMSTK